MRSYTTSPLSASSAEPRWPRFRRPFSHRNEVKKLHTEEETQPRDDRKPIAANPPIHCFQQNPPSESHAALDCETSGVLGV